MTAINYSELALIELEYRAADHLAGQSATSDPLEVADLSLRVRTILTAITALRLALDVTQVSSDPETGVARFRLPVNHPPACGAPGPLCYQVRDTSPMSGRSASMRRCRSARRERLARPFEPWDYQSIVQARAATSGSG